MGPFRQNWLWEDNAHSIFEVVPKPGQVRSLLNHVHLTKK